MGEGVSNRVPPAARSRREQDASPGSATRLANRTDCEISRFLLTEGVALLRSAQCVEPQIDAGEIFDQDTVTLPRMPPRNLASNSLSNHHTRSTP